MKKFIKLIIGSIFVATIVSIFCVGAIDSTKIDTGKGDIAEPQLYQGYDIGKYGISSPEVYEWNADVLYSVARYKKKSGSHSAENYVTTVTSLGGGWVSWHVYCVSDGEEATEYAYINNQSDYDTTAAYYEGYGTTGYKNKLHIKGCYGSVGVGMQLSRCAWCPDSGAPLQDYLGALG